MDRTLSSATLLANAPAQLQVSTFDRLDKKLDVFDQVFLALIIFVLYAGWYLRDTAHFMPSTTQMLQLGTVGISLLGVAVFYSALKLLDFSYTINTSRWFRIHMVLGGSATVAILFHAGFQVGVSNQVTGDIAVGFLVLLAVCGIIGQLVYSHLRYGLLGKNESIEQLRAKLAYSQQRTEFYWECSLVDVMQPIKTFEKRAVKLAENYYLGFVVLALLPLATLCARTWCRYHVNKIVQTSFVRLKTNAPSAGIMKKMLTLHTTKYLTFTTKIIGFTLSQRLFSLWRTLYATLFLLVGLFSVLHIINA